MKASPEPEVQLTFFNLLFAKEHEQLLLPQEAGSPNPYTEDGGLVN